ncbi:MAG: GTP cyclohydrolase I FolE [Bacteroidetes bacterium]|uniref:GTP cyclohydrolase 1 n=2 Tax=Phaeocystidibacter marisrubri TaxID=1577780 RepID=A0A6L3ZJK8_9FLAO|nr:GTP cyclohydrolase I FolE [Phaeocystidibacter marisrubri]TNE30611.1 MAG: GTP cyclohydrolase I FolE [Bacteroidota bacterium]
MKRQETSASSMEPRNDRMETSPEEILHVIEMAGESHVGTSKETPLRSDAFDISDDEKIDRIEEKFRDILEILGMDLNDDSLSGTPRRVAKMYVKEVFQGLNPANKPEAKLFDNKYQYGEMLVEKGITLQSYCEHHFVPILGKCHVAYISNGQVVGLSKINRIVKHFAKRPQVQERLTEQIAEELKAVLNTEDVAVYIDAEHLCVSTRGVEDCGSSTVTTHYGGSFQKKSKRKEFLKYISA